MDLEHAYALKARGLLPRATPGKAPAMKFMRTPSVCEVVLGLLSVDTMKLEFMSIRETQQQQNFRF